jgi:hypothetical protein
MLPDLTRFGMADVHSAPVAQREPQSLPDAEIKGYSEHLQRWGISTK